MTGAGCSHRFLRSLLVVSAITAVTSFALSGLVAFGLWRRSLSEAAIGMASTGWVNANNIGIPVAIYVIGDTAFAAPVVMLQLIVFTPILPTVLDLATSGRTSISRILLQSVRNPIIIGSAVGCRLSAVGCRLSAVGCRLSALGSRSPRPRCRMPSWNRSGSWAPQRSPFC